MHMEAEAPDTLVEEFPNWGLEEPMLSREVDADDPYLVVAPEDMLDITSIYFFKKYILVICTAYIYKQTKNNI